MKNIFKVSLAGIMGRIRRYLTIPLVFLYLLASTGWIVKQDCSQMAQSIASTLEMEAKECCCSTPRKSESKPISPDQNCCQQLSIVKAISNQLSVKKEQDFLSPKPIFLPLQLTLTGYPYFFQDNSKGTLENTSRVGLLQDFPLYKLYQRFIYYG